MTKIQLIIVVHREELMELDVYGGDLWMQGGRSVRPKREECHWRALMQASEPS